MASLVSAPSQLAPDSSSAPATSFQLSSSLPPPPPTSSSPPPPSSPPPTSTPPTSIPPPTSQNTPPATSEQPSPSPSPSSSSSTSTTNTLTPITSSPSSAPPTPRASSSSSSSSLSIVPLSTVTGVINGQTYTSVVEITITQTPSSTSTSAGTNAGSNSPVTGAIVGGVVGGIAGLSALVFLVWLILRKRRQDREDLFDGNFDPARVVSTHNRDNRFDLDDEDQSGTPGITPYPYQPLQMSQQQNSARPSMDQRLLMPSPAPPTGFYANNLTSVAAYAPTQNGNASSWHGHESPPTTNGEYTSSFASRNGGRSPPAVYPAYSAQGPSPGPSIPPSEIGSSGHGHSNSIGSGSMGGSTQRMSAKEREGFGNAASSGRLAVSNATEGEPLMLMSMPVPMAYPYSKQLQQQQQQYQHASSSSPPLPSSTSPPPQSEKGSTTPTCSSVIVHQDAGRLPDESGAEEIPPTYDSLPRNDRR